MSWFYVIGLSFDKTHFTCILVDLGYVLNTSRNHVSRSSVKAFKSIQEIKQESANSLKLNSWSIPAWHLLSVEVYEFQISILIFLGSVNLSMGLLFSKPWTYKMIVLRAIKRYTTCTSIEQTLFKQIVTGDKVLDLVHLFLREVAVYLHFRVLWPSIFLIFIVWMNWRTLQPTIFLDWWLKSRTEIHAIG